MTNTPLSKETTLITVEALSPGGAEVPPMEMEEHIPALLGLRRFIVATRLAFTEETLSGRERTHRIITAAPEKAQVIRGFNTPAETSDQVTTNPVERLTALHRESQVKKIRKAECEKIRLRKVYGVQVPFEESEFQASNSGSIDSIRWEKSRKKIMKNDRGKEHDLGSESHKQRLFGSRSERTPMRHSQRRAELSGAASYKTAERIIATRNRRLDKGSKGETIPSKIRKNSINRATRREERLSTRLVELRRLTELRNQRRVTEAMQDEQ